MYISLYDLSNGDLLGGRMSGFVFIGSGFGVRSRWLILFSLVDVSVEKRCQRISDSHTFLALAFMLTMIYESANDHAFPEVIVSAAHRLERKIVPEGMIGIHFVHIGTNSDAAAALRSLDDHLAT
jgi:hypothetical protein